MTVKDYKIWFPQSGDGRDERYRMMEKGTEYRSSFRRRTAVSGDQGCCRSVPWCAAPMGLLRERPAVMTRCTGGRSRDPLGCKVFRIVLRCSRALPGEGRILIL